MHRASCASVQKHPCLDTISDPVGVPKAQLIKKRRKVDALFHSFFLQHFLKTVWLCKSHSHTVTSTNMFNNSSFYQPTCLNLLLFLCLSAGLRILSSGFRKCWNTWRMNFTTHCVVQSSSAQHSNVHISLPLFLFWICVPTVSVCITASSNQNGNF